LSKFRSICGWDGSRDEDRDRIGGATRRLVNRIRRFGAVRPAAATPTLLGRANPSSHLDGVGACMWAKGAPRGGGGWGASGRREEVIAAG
jgi:hypothetical protein